MFFALSGLVNGLTSSFLGVFVFAKNPRDSRYLSFSLCCLTISIWSYSYFFWQISGQAAQALFWSRALMAGAIFIPVTYLQHVLILLGEKSSRLIKYSYIAGFIFLLCDLTPFYITGVSQKLNFRFWPNPGILFHPFLIIWGLFVIYGTIKIIAGYLYSKENKRNLMGYILLATLIGWGGGATNFLLWYDIPVSPYGNILASAYIAIIAYAITKHHLMDIEVVIKKTAVYSSLTAILTGIFISLILLAQQLFSGFLGQTSLWAGLVAAFVIAMVFQPLRDAIQRLVDRLFFKGKYDYRNTLKGLSHSSATIIDLDQLISSTSANVSEALKPEKVSFYLWDKEKDLFRLNAPSPCPPPHFMP